MHARRTACAALLVLAVATTGCSSGNGSGPAQPSAFPGTTPNASKVAADRACVDAWVDLLLAHPRHWNPGADTSPEECADRTEADQMNLYFEASDKAAAEQARRAAASPIDDGASLTASETGRP